MRTILERLNGWQRLWVVVTAVYGLAVGVFTVSLLPTDSEVTSLWASAALGELAGDIGKSLNKDVSVWDLKESESFKNKTDKEIAEKITENAKNINQDDPDKKNLASFRKNILFIERDYQERLENVLKEQLKVIGIALLAWLLPASGLYILGYAAAWVYRGFRQK